MAANPQEIIDKILAMKDAQMKAMGIDNFGSEGYKANQALAAQDAQTAAKWKNIDELNKQRDLMTTGRLDRENKQTLDALQYGAGGSVDRTNQRYIDAANIGLQGQRYTADKGLEGQNVQAQAHRYGSDTIAATGALQHGPGGSDERVALIQHPVVSNDPALIYHNVGLEALKASIAANPLADFTTHAKAYTGAAKLARDTFSPPAPIITPQDKGLPEIAPIQQIVPQTTPKPDDSLYGLGQQAVGAMDTITGGLSSAKQNLIDSFRKKKNLEY